MKKEIYEQKTVILVADGEPVIIDPLSYSKEEVGIMIENKLNGALNIAACNVSSFPYEKYERFKKLIQQAINESK